MSKLRVTLMTIITTTTQSFAGKARFDCSPTCQIVEEAEREKTSRKTRLFCRERRQSVRYRMIDK